MKKIMVSFVVLIGVFLLAGCGSGQQGITPVDTRTPTVQATVTTSGTASATPSPGPTSPINALWMSDATTGWAVVSDSNTGGVAQILIEHWNGSRWSVVTSPSPSSKGSSLSGVAVVSASSIWAVGDFMKSGSQQVFVEHWNGTSWQVVPNPSVGTSSTFWAVGAVSAKDVWAVGDTANGNQGFQTLTEQWNGSRWSVVASPSPGSTNTSLNGVAAISASSVWAVGNAESNTLTEHDQC